jgi:hypothetical protein
MSEASDNELRGRYQNRGQGVGNNKGIKFKIDGIPGNLWGEYRETYVGSDPPIGSSSPHIYTVATDVANVTAGQVAREDVPSGVGKAIAVIENNPGHGPDQDLGGVAMIVLKGPPL